MQPQSPAAADATQTVASSTITIRQHAVSIGLVLCVSVLSVLYGLLTTENAVTMGVRGDVSPLYLPLGPYWTTAIPKLLLAQWVCIAPGELAMAIVVLLASGRLERTLGSLRFAAVVVALLVARCATVCAWCVLVSGASILQVRICPSVLWLCTSLYMLRICLLRSRGQLLLVQTVPVNQHLLQHALMLQLAWTYRARFWDTTLPAGVVATLLCSEFMSMHQWKIADGSFVDRCLQRVLGRRRLRPELRKTLRRLPASSAMHGSNLPANRGAPVTDAGSSREWTGARRSATQPQPSLAHQHDDAPRRVPGVPADVAESPGVPLTHHTHDGVSLLVDMGFTEEASREALLLTNGDTNAAATLLLQGGVHR